MKKCFILCVVVILTGCFPYKSFKTDNIFDQNNKNGLFVMGLNVRGDFKKPTSVFIQYDPATGKANPKSYVWVESKDIKNPLSNSNENSLEGSTQYLFFDLPPGNWILLRVYALEGDGNKSYFANTYFESGALSFTSISGAASFLGDYMVGAKFGQSLVMKSAGSNLERAKLELMTYKNINVPLLNTNINFSPYTCTYHGYLMGDNKDCDYSTLVIRVK